MSTIVSNNVQIGQSGTATDNFTLYQPLVADGTVRLANGNTGSTTDLVTVTSAGNVGIGTASPSVPLHVVGNSGIRAERSGLASITMLAGSSGEARLDTSILGRAFQVNGDATISIKATSGAGVGAINIDSSGNVGIGTSSPSYMLHVSGTLPRIELTDTDTGSSSYISNQSTVGSLLIAANENAVGSTSVLAFRNLGTERMRIDSSGNLLVGTTNATGDGTGIELTPNYQHGGYIAVKKSSVASSDRYIIFTNAGNVIGSITANGTTAVAYNTSSDYRLKENIQPMQGALAVVQQLNPVTYTWKADGSDGQGFIAHELQAVVPDCVTGEKDAVDKDGNPVYQGIDTSFLVATLTKAIQELTARVEALEAK